MDITTIIAVVSSAAVFLAWFVLPGAVSSPTVAPALPEVLPAEAAAA